jgi:UDP-glucose 4-epimerase
LAGAARSARIALVGYLEFENAVVTGGAGYIGGHLADRLLATGTAAMVIDDMSKGTYINPKADFVKADLRADGFILPENSTVFHLAADPDIKESMENTGMHFSRDVTATLNVLEKMRRSDAKLIVFASTSAVYGNAERIPTDEAAPVHPISNYALYKVLCEEMTKYYSEVYGLRAVVLRFANVVGGRTGHGILYNFVQKIKNDKPFEIWGDGRQNKNYIYIDDLLDAMLMLAGRRVHSFDIFNIGSRGTTSVEEIVGMFRTEIRREYEAVRIEKQKGDVRTMLLDIGKAEQSGWSPKLDSEQAVSMAIKDILKMNGIGSQK